MSNNLDSMQSTVDNRTSLMNGGIADDILQQHRGRGPPGHPPGGGPPSPPQPQQQQQHTVNEITNKHQVCDSDWGLPQGGGGNSPPGLPHHSNSTSIKDSYKPQPEMSMPISSALPADLFEEDDLGFDPFHETQKALAEMLESESKVQAELSGLKSDQDGFKDKIAALRSVARALESENQLLSGEKENLQNFRTSSSTQNQNTDAAPESLQTTDPVLAGILGDVLDEEPVTTTVAGEEIGELDKEWNWLAMEYEEKRDINLIERSIAEPVAEETMEISEATLDHPNASFRDTKRAKDVYFLRVFYKIPLTTENNLLGSS